MFYLNAPLTTTVSISSGGINITRQTIFFYVLKNSHNSFTADAENVYHLLEDNPSDIPLPVCE
jgi:hypothetical protein